MANTQLAYMNELKSLSLLSATTGQLEIARLPVVDKPDWIIPRSLILEVVPFSDRIWTYLWQDTTHDRAVKQDVSMYHLFPKNLTPSYIVVVESFTDVHRIGLQIVGDVVYHQIRIADLKDAEDAASSENDREQLPSNVPHLLDTGDSTLVNTGDVIPTTPSPALDTRNLAPQSVEQTFIFQPVIFQGELCVIPDLDKLSHYLVDLDS